MIPLIFYFTCFLIFLPIKCGHYRQNRENYNYQAAPRLIQHVSRPPYVQICHFLKPKPTFLSDEASRHPKRSKSGSKNIRFRNVRPPLLYDSPPSSLLSPSSGGSTPEWQFHLWEHLYPVSTFINGRPHKTQIPIFIQQSPLRQTKLSKSFPKKGKTLHQSSLESGEHHETPPAYEDEFLNIAFEDESSSQGLPPAKTQSFKNYEQKMPKLIDFADDEADELYQDSQLSEISESLPISGDLQFPKPEPDKETLNLGDNFEENNSDIEVEFPQTNTRARVLHVTFDGTTHSDGPKYGLKMDSGFSQMSVSIQSNLNDTTENDTEFETINGNFTVNSTIFDISADSLPLNDTQASFNKE